MAAVENKLIVFAHIAQEWRPCGQLQMTEDGVKVLASNFAYGTQYCRRADALEVDPVSLSLADPDQVAGKRLQPANNLALFGGIRDAAPDSWGRRVIESKLKVPANSLPESDYLLHAGSDRVGALDIRQSRDVGPTPGHTGPHDMAHLLEAADRIEEGLPVPAHLESIFVNGTALGGARPKATIRDETGRLWLAKFSSTKDSFDVPGIECASLQLAARAGLRVPELQVRHIGDRKIMLIQRFDRYWSNPGSMPQPTADLLGTRPDGNAQELRLAFVSGLTMVACDESESNTKAYADLAQAVRAHCHPSVIQADNEELFKRMVYNVFVSNDDDHLRNHGFLFDPRIRGWRLSPLYDVLPRPSLATDRFLHLGVGPQGRLATLDNALASHAMFTLSQTEAAQLITEVWAVVREWQVYFEEYGVSAHEIGKIAPAFRHIDDITTADTRRLLGR